MPLPKNKPQITSQQIGIFITGFLIGLLFIYQYNSYQKIHDIVNDRDSSRNIFEEMNLLLIHNQKLKEEIDDLREELNDYSDQTTAAITLEKEIGKSKKIAGLSNIQGPGISISISSPIDDVWWIDSMNEIFTAGAEAVSINNIRIVDDNAGFLFTGEQIIINGVALQKPFTVKAIGDPNILLQALDQPGGIIKRMETFYPENHIAIEKEEIIQIEKIL